MRFKLPDKRRAMSAFKMYLRGDEECAVVRLLWWHVSDVSVVVSLSDEGSLTGAQRSSSLWQMAG